MDNQNQADKQQATDITSSYAYLIYYERLRIYEERLRQASTAFNLAFAMTTMSAITGFVGIILLFFGNISTGTITAAGGGIYGSVTVSWLKLAKDSNDRLDEVARALKANS